MADKVLMVPPNLAGRRHAVFQITPNRNCNIRCDHCFISNRHKAITSHMSLGLYKRSLDVCMEFSKRIPSMEEADIVLMGGELALLPDDLQEGMYRHTVDRVIEHLAETAGSGRPQREVSCAIISNMINVGRDKLDVFVRAFDYYRARLDEERHRLGGLSFDLTIDTSWEPDTGRFYKPHVYEQWLDNVRYMLARGVAVGLALTGTRGVVTMDVKERLDFFVRDLGVVPMYDHFAEYGEGRANGAHLKFSYDEMVRFLIAFGEYAERLAEERGEVVASPFFRAGRTMEQLHSRLLAILCVDWDGAIAMDSESSAETQHTRKDSVHGRDVLCVTEDADDGLVDAIVEQAQRRLVRESRALATSACADCRHLPYCQGGFVHYVGRFDGPGQCAGFKQVFDHFCPEHP